MCFFGLSSVLAAPAPASLAVKTTQKKIYETEESAPSILDLPTGAMEGKEEEDGDGPLGSQPIHPPKSQKVEIKNLDTKFRNSLSLTLDPFRILILDDIGPLALLGLEVVLQVETLEKTEIIKAVWPKIYSYVFQDLYSIAPFLWETGYTPTRKSFEKRLLRLCHGFFGPGVIKGVVVQKAYLRPLRSMKKRNLPPAKLLPERKF